MAELTFIEKSRIERFLGMKSGYVMDFSDRTFQEFVEEATGLNINSEKYHYASNSKANRLRCFIKKEPNFIFGKLLKAFCEYWLAKAQTGEINYVNEEVEYKECVMIADRLMKDNIVEHLDSIQPNTDEISFALLAKSIKASIEKNEPESALDRLHTFTVKYFRSLCDKYGLVYVKEEPLNSVFGKYIKYLVVNKYLESTMSQKILKFSISILEAFNDVRNNRSFAHDNQILNYHESILIFNNISNLIKFIQQIENNLEQKLSKLDKIDWDNLPF